MKKRIVFLCVIVCIFFCYIPINLFANIENFHVYQTVQTKGACDIEYFTINENYYLAIANRNDGTTPIVNSEILKWDGSYFVPFQSVLTYGANDFESFSINSQFFLAVANRNENVTYSEIFKWNNNKFESFQKLSIIRGADIDFFSIDDDHYLAVASQQEQYCNSIIYKWNGNSFEEFKLIPAFSGAAWEYFTINNETYIILVNRLSNSKIYKWSNNSFEEFQTISSSDAVEAKSFIIDDKTYLAVANTSYSEGDEIITHNIESFIYVFNGTKFIEIQKIKTYGAKDWECFTFNNDTYLIVANFYDQENSPTKSYIYKWNGFQFIRIDSLPIITNGGAKDWEKFIINNETYLAVANVYNSEREYNMESIIYKISQNSIEHNEINNINDIQFSGATSSFSDNILKLNNVRIDSSDCNINDYVTVNYAIDYETMQFKPISTMIIKDVGIYSSEYSLFAKDIFFNMYMVKSRIGLDPQILFPDVRHDINVNSNESYTMSLEKGTVLSIRIYNSNDILEFLIDSPNGIQVLKESINPYENFKHNLPILTGGVYNFNFFAENNSNASFQLEFHNNNNNDLEIISSNSFQISGLKLDGWGNEYAKYKIALNKGDFLNVSGTFDEDIILSLLDSNSQNICTVNGDLKVKIQNSGDYYLFIINKNYSGFELYSGTINIISDSEIDKYPIINNIENQIITEKANISIQITATNNPSFNAVGLPSSININKDSGLITGFSSITGVFPIIINATNEFGTDEKTFLLIIDENFKISLKDIIHGLKVLTNFSSNTD